MKREKFTEMKEIPIPFSSPMVRAILEGKKNQTRMILKNIPMGAHKIWFDGAGWIIENKLKNTWSEKLNCKYERGGKLWVRETWRKNDWPTGWPFEYRATAERDMTPVDGPWRRSIFMPKEACRIKLEVTDVSAERLNDITDADALAEGVLSDQNIFVTGELTEAYKTLWKSINGKGSWEKNPWVWVIKFDNINDKDCIIKNLPK